MIETFDFHSALDDDDDECLQSCWGHNLRGSGGCTPGFQAGKGHFKNKFCTNCQALIVLPVERVCAAGGGDMGNQRSEGFWNEGAHGCFRVVNNTAACVDPPLAIYRDAPPEATRAGWTRVPEHWVDTDGLTVRLCVAKGTLVPVLSLRSGHHLHAAAEKEEEVTGSEEAHEEVTEETAAVCEEAPAETQPADEETEMEVDAPVVARALPVAVPAAALRACRVVTASAPPRPHLVCSCCGATWRSAWWEMKLMDELKQQSQRQQQMCKPLR